MDHKKKDFRKLYEDLVKSDWFKKAYHDKSLGECPFEIPELAESEDERIRKELIGMIKECTNWPHKNEYVKYLEKQKEQRPISFYGHYNPDDYEVVVDGNATRLKKKEQKIDIDKEKLIRHCIGLILTDATDKRFKDYGLTLKDCLTWLGEQKEQKPSGETNVEPDSKIPREEYLYHLLANNIITFTDYTYLLAKKPFDYECANIIS